MATTSYAVLFNGDGTYTSTPSPMVIIPGTSFSITGQITVNFLGATIPFDLTNVTLTMVMINKNGGISLYRSGPPTFITSDAPSGQMTITIGPATSIYLPSGIYTLEIKGVGADGSRYQICSAPITVGSSSIAGI